MRKYNISKPEKYIKDGVEKTYWANVGTMTEFDKPDGTVSRIMEIPAIGLKANIFPVQDKDATKPASSTKKTETADAPINEFPDEEDIDPNDIPF